MNKTTIAAVSTAQGTGGIAVIRISGEQAIQIADRVFVAANGKKLETLKGYTASYGGIFSGGVKIDEAVATVFRAPNSYTGEDVAELSCHGGIFLTEQVLRAVFDNGAAPAQAGEFTKRAFLNGKLDLTEAEAVMELIGAKSTAAARTALALREGALSKKINSVKEEILNAAAHLNAWADYPEDDIPEVTAENLKTTFTEAEKLLSDLLKNYDRGQAVMEGVDTVIAGKPNVGKSTLMNLLTGSEKSIVTDIAGTTRDIIESTAIVGNVVLRLSDTAGLRETGDEIEKIGVERAKKRLLTCGLVLAVFDGSKPLEKEDFELLEAVENIPCIAIINKSDLPAAFDISIIQEKVSQTVYICAKNSGEIEKLSQIIAELLGTEAFDPSAAILANERQRQAAAAALDALKDANTALDLGMTFDAITVDLENAAASLLELTGERASEAVVDRVFSNFCVGK